MSSFEELGLAPHLVEALASEGIETPTALQELAIPVLRRGTSAVLQAAPGAGLLVAYGAPLLDRLQPESGQPTVIVLTPERKRARSLALSLANLALGTGHHVGALGVPWAQPERSDILFSTLEDLYRAISSASIKTDQVTSLVLDGAAALLRDAEEEPLSTALQALTSEGLQIIVLSDRVTPAVRRWVEEHLRRGVFLPPEAAGDSNLEAPVRRGTIQVYSVEDDVELALPLVVSELLDRGCAHVLIFARSEDRAADLGDLLTLHGFRVGRPGDLQASVWLGVDPLEARAALSDLGEEVLSVATVSVDVPADVDELDRRHGGPAGGGVVTVYPRELPHLRRAAREAGYNLEPWVSASQAGEGEASSFIAQLEAVLEEEDLVPYLAFLEPIIRRRGAAEVAAALAALLRTKSRAHDQPGPRGSDSPHQPGGTSPSRRPPAWARLFLSVGQRDGIAAGDLLGAITGETEIEGSQVGRIDVKESFSRVEVHDSVADRVIRSLNGTSIRGRSVRVDYDRGETRTQGRSSPQKKAARTHGRGQGR